MWYHLNEGTWQHCQPLRDPRAPFLIWSVKSVLFQFQSKKILPETLALYSPGYDLSSVWKSGWLYTRGGYLAPREPKKLWVQNSGRKWASSWFKVYRPDNSAYLGRNSKILQIREYLELPYSIKNVRIREEFSNSTHFVQVLVFAYLDHVPQTHTIFEQLVMVLLTDGTSKLEHWSKASIEALNFIDAWSLFSSEKLKCSGFVVTSWPRVDLSPTF